ncbi:aminoglycoside phosphotransferase family protein [uncultured Stenotrophomonas sp.]|uniref:aminoglycoside phosphotransferase family protein n=1 Tax=uncultured Stenotrophomonas sp. TaxID=165438 RepID=UPI0025DB6DC6|nr:aminoglycoside phosphotransferase family protein [uncultured Stenotrophomonas sp.]
MSEPYLSRWRLRRDGPAIQTPRAQLWPVLTHAGEPAMLKLSSEPEEQNAYRLLRWWEGDGAARLLAHEGPAILIERARGDSLRQRSIDGGDDTCTTILCQVLQRLHRPRNAPPAELVCLRTWFADLLQPRARLPPLLEQCRSLAEALLQDFAARLEQVSALACLERTRLLRWIAASMGLSAVWFRDDGDPADIDEAVATMALEALAQE